VRSRQKGRGYTAVVATESPPTKGEPASTFDCSDRSEEQSLLRLAQTLKLPASLAFNFLIQNKVESFRLEKGIGIVIRAN